MRTIRSNRIRTEEGGRGCEFESKNKVYDLILVLCCHPRELFDTSWLSISGNRERVESALRTCKLLISSETSSPTFSRLTSSARVHCALPDQLETLSRPTLAHGRLSLSPSSNFSTLISLRLLSLPHPLYSSTPSIFHSSDHLSSLCG